MSEAHNPTISEDGTLTYPLNSGEWELIVDAEGILHLANVTTDQQSGEQSRYIIEIGEIASHIGSPGQLIEGINLIRSHGQSTALAN